MDSVTYAILDNKIEETASGISNIVPITNGLRFTTLDGTNFDVALPTHTHSNLATILEKFTLDSSNNLLFNGQPIKGNIDLTPYLKIVDADVKYELKDSTIVKDANYVHTDNNYTTTEKNKLTSLNNFSKDYNELINKPVIPSIDGLASELYVNNKIASIPTNDLTSYEKIVDVTAKLLNKADTIHLHEITDVINLQTSLNNRYVKAETMSKEAIEILFNTVVNNRTWKASINTFANLPLTGNDVSDTRVVIENSTIYIWDGTTWIDLGGSGTTNLATIGLDGLLSKEDKAKLDSIIVANLITTQQLADAMVLKSDITHTHNNYVEKATGASLPLDIKQAEWDAKADIGDIPTKISNLTNDSGFITSSGVDTKLIGYQTETQINTKLVDYAKTTDVSNAVTNSHTHTNKVVIDKFTEVGGKPYYDGSAIGGGTGVSTWNAFNL